jgi:hypothetical protein
MEQQRRSEKYMADHKAGAKDLNNCSQAGFHEYGTWDMSGMVFSTRGVARVQSQTKSRPVKWVILGHGC